MTDINTTIDDNAHEILQKIDEAWPSPIVLRKDIGKFSCGLVTHRSMETADQRGWGISGRISINGKVAYKKESALKWLGSRIKQPAADDDKQETRKSHKKMIFC
jgi:hypothetical protein